MQNEKQMNTHQVWNSSRNLITPTPFQVLQQLKM